MLALLLSIVMMAGMSTILTSCGNDDDKAEDNLVGTWVSYEDASDGSAHYYIFNKNRSGMYFGITWAEDPDIFTDYKVANGRLMIKWEGDDDWDDEGAIQVDKKQFTIDYGEGDVLIYTKVK